MLEPKILIFFLPLLLLVQAQDPNWTKLRFPFGRHVDAKSSVTATEAPTKVVLSTPATTGKPDSWNLRRVHPDTVTDTSELKDVTTLVVTDAANTVSRKPSKPVTPRTKILLIPSKYVKPDRTTPKPSKPSSILPPTTEPITEGSANIDTSANTERVILVYPDTTVLINKTPATTIPEISADEPVTEVVSVGKIAVESTTPIPKIITRYPDHSHDKHITTPTPSKSTTTESVLPTTEPVTENNSNKDTTTDTGVVKANYPDTTLGDMSATTEIIPSADKPATVSTNGKEDTENVGKLTTRKPFSRPEYWNLKAVHPEKDTPEPTEKITIMVTDPKVDNISENQSTVTDDAETDVSNVYPDVIIDDPESTTVITEALKKESALTRYIPQFKHVKTTTTTIAPYTHKLPFTPSRLKNVGTTVKPIKPRTKPTIKPNRSSKHPWNQPYIPKQPGTTAKPPPKATTTIRPKFKMPSIGPDPSSNPVNTFQVWNQLVDYVCQKPQGYESVAGQCDVFVECKVNIANQYRCPDGLHFNPEARWPDYPCAYPSEVECESEAVIQSANPTAQCPHRYGFFPVNECGQYIVCNDGIAKVMNCPAGLVFNFDKDSCDWPINVPECNPEVFEDFTCPAVPVGDIDIYKYRYKKSCSKYIGCQQGHPRLLSCDSGFYFDEAEERCVDADLVPDCIE